MSEPVFSLAEVYREPADSPADEVEAAVSAMLGIEIPKRESVRPLAGPNELMHLIGNVELWLALAAGIFGKKYLEEAASATWKKTPEVLAKARKIFLGGIRKKIESGGSVHFELDQPRLDEGGRFNVFLAVNVTDEEQIARLLNIFALAARQIQPWVSALHNDKSLIRTTMHVDFAGTLTVQAHLQGDVTYTRRFKEDGTELMPGQT